MDDSARSVNERVARSAVDVLPFGLTVHDGWLAASRGLALSAAGRMVSSTIELASAVDLVVGRTNLLDSVEEVGIESLLSAFSEARDRGQAVLELSMGAVLELIVSSSSLDVWVREPGGVVLGGRVGLQEVCVRLQDVRGRLVERGLAEPLGSAARSMAARLTGAGVSVSAVVGGAESPRGVGPVVSVSLTPRRLERAAAVFFAVCEWGLGEGEELKGVTASGRLVIAGRDGRERVMRAAGRRSGPGERMRVCGLEFAKLAAQGDGERECVGESLWMPRRAMRHRSMRIWLDGSELRVGVRGRLGWLATLTLPLEWPTHGWVTRRGEVVFVDDRSGQWRCCAVVPTGWLAVAGG